jgi:hypothetical protein
VVQYFTTASTTTHHQKTHFSRSLVIAVYEEKERHRRGRMKEKVRQ